MVETDAGEECVFSMLNALTPSSPCAAGRCFWIFEQVNADVIKIRLLWNLLSPLTASMCTERDHTPLSDSLGVCCFSECRGDPVGTEDPCHFL